MDCMEIYWNFSMTYWNFFMTYAYQKARNYAVFGASVIKIPFNILKSRKVVLSNKCLRQWQRLSASFRSLEENSCVLREIILM